MIMSLEQKEIKFKPRTKLNHNIATSYNLLHINKASFISSLVATGCDKRLLHFES